MTVKRYVDIFGVLSNEVETIPGISDRIYFVKRLVNYIKLLFSSERSQMMEIRIFSTSKEVYTLVSLMGIFDVAI